MATDKEKIAGLERQIVELREMMGYTKPKAEPRTKMNRKFLTPEGWDTTERERQLAIENEHRRQELLRQTGGTLVAH